MRNIKTRAPLEIPKTPSCFYKLHFINVWRGKGVRAINCSGALLIALGKAVLWKKLEV